MDRQERIEKAVIDLGGEWPTTTASNYCLFTTSDDWSGSDDFAGTYRAGRTDGRVGEGERLQVSPDGWVFVCSITEFMEARDRMKNAPFLYLQQIGQANRSPFRNNEHEWDGDGLPLEGTDCEYRLGNNGIWHPCTVRYILEGDNDPDVDGWRAVIWCPHLGKDQVAYLDRFQFRPIQSHRDKVISAAETECSGIVTSSAAIEHLYEIGALVYPGENS